MYEHSDAISQMHRTSFPNFSCDPLVGDVIEGPLCLTTKNCLGHCSHPDLDHLELRRSPRVRPFYGIATDFSYLKNLPRNGFAPSYASLALLSLPGVEKATKQSRLTSSEQRGPRRIGAYFDNRQNLRLFLASERAYSDCRSRIKLLIE